MLQIHAAKTTDQTAPTMLIGPILLAWVWAGGHSDAVSDDATTVKDTSSSLCSKVDHLKRMMVDQLQQHHEQVSSFERKLLEQQRQLSEQGVLIRQQATDMSQQVAINRQQATELSQQVSINRQQAADLSQQVSINRQQATELSQQVSINRQQATDLSQQVSINRQQATELSQQVLINRQQATDLSQQVSINRQQATELSQQVVINRQQAEKLSQRDGIIQQQVFHAAHAPCKESSRSRQSVAEPKPSILSSESLGKPIRPDDEGLELAPRDVVARSDDAGPLEAVVNQVSRRVAELSADIQALKTQTSLDIQTLTTQTSADIQSVKTQTNADIQTLTTQTNADIKALQNSVLQQGLGIADARTSNYVHWGSSGCDNASQVIYTGVVGGGYHGFSGAATNYLCLPMSPVVSDRALPAKYGYLYGAEYETSDSHQNMDAVCSVCRSRHSNTVMIPATNVCTPGWHARYTGFLMAGYWNDPAGSEYICVDSNFHSRPGSDANDDDKQLYFVLGVCGSLPCEPYVNNKIVTCVVCSQ